MTPVETCDYRKLFFGISGPPFCHNPGMVRLSGRWYCAEHGAKLSETSGATAGGSRTGKARASWMDPAAGTASPVSDVRLVAVCDECGADLEAHECKEGNDGS